MRKNGFKFLVLVLVMFLSIGTIADANFIDVSPDFWGYAKIIEFFERGIVKGYENGTFKPDSFLTRAEFVTIVNNYFGFSGNEDKLCDFPDVDQNEWYAKAINEAKVRGYISGYPDKTFRPQENITRQEAIVVLANIFNIAEDIPEEDKDYFNRFSDSFEIGDWAQNAVYGFLKYGIIKGYDDGSLKPAQFITRAEAIHLFKPTEDKIIIEEKPVENPKRTSSGGGSGGSSGGSSSRPTPSTTPSAEPTITPSTTPSTEPTTTPTATPSTEPTTTPTTTPSTQPTIPPIVEEEEVCNCADCVNNLINVIEDIAKTHVNLLIKELESVEGDTEAIKEILESWLNAEIDDEIEALIEQLINTDYEAISNGVMEKLEEIAHNEMVQDVISKLEKVIPENDKAQIKKLLNALKEKTDISNDEVEAFINNIIENHDCDETQALINKIIGVLENIDSMDEVISLIRELVEEYIPREEIEEIIDELTEKYQTTIEELKEKIEQEINDKKTEIREEINKKIEALKEEKARIEAIVNEIITEIKDRIPTKEELEALKAKIESEVEKLVKEGKASVEEIKKEIKTKLEEILSEENLEKLWDKIVEEVKTQITENVPTEEELKEIEDKFDTLLAKVFDEIKTNIPEIEEATGIDFSEIAKGLGVDLDTLESMIKSEEVKEVIKNEIVKVIVETLSNNDDVKNALETIYGGAKTDVVEMVLFLNENDFTGITVGIILSNTELTELLATMDEKLANSEISDAEVETIVEMAAKYYGLSNFIKSVNGRDDAKKLITVALEYADLLELSEAIIDSSVQEILLDTFTRAEIVSILKLKGGNILNLFLGIVTVNYDKNAGDATGTMNTSEHAKYTIPGLYSNKLNENKFEREGYIFDEWNTKADGTGVSYAAEKAVLSTEFPNGFDGTLYATWKVASSVNVVVTNGTIEVSKTDDVTVGEEIEILSITPDTGYRLKVDSLKVTDKNDNVITVTNNKFTMPESMVTITATFELIPYNVDITVNGSGKASVLSSIQGITSFAESSKLSDINYNDDVYILYLDDVVGYDFESLIAKKIIDQGEITEISEEQILEINLLVTTLRIPYKTFKMPASDVNVVVNFKGVPTKTITAPSEITGGEIELSRDGIVYTNPLNAEIGETVYVKASPSYGYAIETFTVGSDTSLEKVKTFVTEENVDVEMSATFKRSAYKVNKESDGGTISSYVKKGIIRDYLSLPGVGENVFIETVKEDYVVTSISVKDSEGDSVDLTASDLAKGTAEFIMPDSEVTVTVTFEQVVFPITTEWYDEEGNTVEGGTISLNKKKAMENTSIEFTLGKVTGYEIASVEVDGEILTASEGKYTFQMPGEAVEIAVTLAEKNVYTVTTSITGESGTVKVSVDGVNYNSDGLEFEPEDLEEEKIVYIKATGDKYWESFSRKQYKVTSITTDNDSIELIETNLEEGTARFKMPKANVEVIVKFSK